jgi:hypothetical protein
MQDRMMEVIEILSGKLPIQYQMMARTLLQPFTKSINPDNIPEFCETARGLLNYIQYGDATAGMTDTQ